MPRKRRLALSALLLTVLATIGWLLFAFGSAGLVLRSGDCAGRPPTDLLILGWLGLVSVAALAPPALLLAKGEWPPALRAIGIGGACALVLYALALVGVSAGCL